MNTFDPKTKIIKDSISYDGSRLTTVQIRYPRLIHSELMTHRAFSRNARSSRAVPVKTLIEEAENNIYLPYFLKNKAGMQATDNLSTEDLEEAEKVWNDMAKYTIDGVKKLNELGIHKQWANRPLEWFGYIDVLITSTDWANFFALRDSEYAQPEIQIIAKSIKNEMELSIPEYIDYGKFHMPYINEDSIKIAKEYCIKNNLIDCDLILMKMSVSRCARISYAPFDGDGSVEKELQRFSLLAESYPVHASAIEHVATPDQSYYKVGETEKSWKNKNLHGNFYGWCQYRKMITNNTVYDERI